MNKFYDMIALDYDQLIEDDVRNDNFQYGAYKELQEIIINYIYDNKHLSKAKILDIGIGTGSLYETIMPEKYDLTGIDISKKMLEVSTLKLPNAKLIHHDILKGMPEELDDEKYDYIVINYLFKHFDTDTFLSLIGQLTRYLAPFGKIFVGDILFLDETRRHLFFRDHPQLLQYDYHFHIYNKIVKKADESLALSFMEINSYTGLLLIEKYYESSLHFAESLIKYK